MITIWSYEFSIARELKIYIEVNLPIALWLLMQAVWILLALDLKNSSWYIHGSI